MRSQHALTLCCLFILSFVLLGNANDVNRRRIRSLASNNKESVADVSSIPTLFFDQVLDHFVPNNGEQVTFQQRYYVNQSFYTTGGPAFLIIGGESALYNTSVTRGSVVEMAAKYNAMLFALEHRYYGMSSPFDTLNGTTLPYLNTQQALADLVNFQQAMIQEHNISQAKWVVFGCSYPGVLSAWFRAKFPNLAVASLSSSSPVEAVLDFYQYDQYVANSVGAQCANSIRNATFLVQQLLMNNETNENIRQRLGCIDVTDPVAVLYVLADTVAYVVQYNHGIQQMCGNFTNSTNLVDTYVNFVTGLFANLGETCISFDISSFTNETVSPTEMMRQWMWQSCDELGYFQTAPANNSLRSPLITADWHLQVCRKLFNNATYGPKISWTNNYYGGNNSLLTSNTVFTNGMLDPWQALSVTKDLSASVPSILIAEEAHCANWYASAPNDPAPLVTAREQQSNYIGAFLDSCTAGCGANGICSFSRKGNEVSSKCACLNGKVGDSCDKNPIPWWSLLVLGLGLVVISVIVVVYTIRVTRARFYSRV